MRKNPAAVALGRKGGAAKSAAKSQASRQNGQLGGRPKAESILAECCDSILRHTPPSEYSVVRRAFTALQQDFGSRKQKKGEK